jgi:hypothetical protein
MYPPTFSEVEGLSSNSHRSVCMPLPPQRSEEGVSAHAAESYKYERWPIYNKHYILPIISRSTFRAGQISCFRTTGDTGATGSRWWLRSCTFFGKAPDLLSHPPSPDPVLEQYWGLLPVLDSTGVYNCDPRFDRLSPYSCLPPGCG